jgi:hypothetical protein
MNMVQSLAIKFVERSEALGYKGVKRDNAALDFFVGAGAALRIVGHAEAAHVENVAVMLVAMRGFGELKRIRDEVVAEAKIIELAAEKEAAAA